MRMIDATTTAGAGERLGHDPAMRATRLRLGRAPRVLFLAWPFPPAMLAGSTRTWNLATRLADEGWDVTVATVPPRQWLRVENADGSAAALARHGVSRMDVATPLPLLAPRLLR